MSRARDFPTREFPDQEKLVWSRVVRPATMTRAHVTRWSWSGFLWSRFWSRFGFWSRVGSRGTSGPVLGSCDSDQRVLVRIRSGVRFKSPVPGQERSGQDPGHGRVPDQDQREVPSDWFTHFSWIRQGCDPSGDPVWSWLRSRSGPVRIPVRSGFRSGLGPGPVSVRSKSVSAPQLWVELWCCPI